MAIITRLSAVITKIACAGKFFTASTFPAPKYWEIIEEIALLVCPSTQISMDKNVVTIPTAARDVVAFCSILPIIAASVKDKIGSATPDINAGMANLLMFFKVMFVFKIRVHNSEKDVRFVLGNRYHQVFDIYVVHKISCFYGFVKKYLILQKHICFY